MAYITNDGARLIERARTEGKSIFFGSVRMNTVYKSDPTSLVQKTEEWYGENHGSVVGCISHVSVNGVSEVCDSKLAIQCNDNSESWKSIGIYAHLDGEEDEVLLACESIENGEYKDVTIVELPVTLDGVFEDFGLSEGGSGGGGEGGGGEVPANMMTTDTVQNDLTGSKMWAWENYYGGGSLDNPRDGDRWASESLTINYIFGNHIPLALNSNISQYSSKEGWQDNGHNRLRITADKVHFNDSFASWSDIIISAERGKQGFDHANIRQSGDGSIEIGVVQVKPNSEIKIGSCAILVIDSNSKIASVRASGYVLDVSVAVFDNGNMHRVSGIISKSGGLSFDAPITPAEGQEIYIHWTRYE